MEYKRLLKLLRPLEMGSFFLFGPRSTGKSYLIKQDLLNISGIKYYDLLDNDVYSKFIRNIKIIETDIIEQKLKIVIIDEVQKYPAILDEVHRLIENYKIRFLLTGSSARKLRHRGVNLLGGRAGLINLFPLTSREIEDFDLDTYLVTGGMPSIYKNEHYYTLLKNYIELYLKEEIANEAIVRRLDFFYDFFDKLGLLNGKELNFRKIASDLAVTAPTVQNYLSILEDTLIGFFLKPFNKTKKRKATMRSKFYFFDIGVTNYLNGRIAFDQKCLEYGMIFEHFIILEIRAYLSYRDKPFAMQYFRSTGSDQIEIDLIINDTAIEIKSSTVLNNHELKGLRAFKEEKVVKKYFLVTRTIFLEKTFDEIIIYPWKEFLDDLWADKLF